MKIALPRSCGGRHYRKYEKRLYCSRVGEFNLGGHFVPLLHTWYGMGVPRLDAVPGAVMLLLTVVASVTTPAISLLFVTKIKLCP
jgi:hypothetical protein